MLRHLFLLTLLGCAGTPAAPTSNPAPVEDWTDRKPKAAPDKPQPTLMLAAPDELGSAYTFGTHAAVHVRRGNLYTMAKTGEIKTMSGCQLDGPLWVARTADLRLPTAAEWVASDGRIPADNERPFAHVRMDSGVCLKATRCNTPLHTAEPGTVVLEYWIDAKTGKVTPMAVGGGSQQCLGECEWFSSVDH